MESVKPYDISQALQIKPENRKHALGDSLVLHHVADARIEFTAEWQAQKLTQVAQLVCSHAAKGSPSSDALQKEDYK